MEYNLCINDKEVEDIILKLQSENSKLTKDDILKAIKSCCLEKNIIKKNNTILDCVRERIKMMKIFP